MSAAIIAGCQNSGSDNNHSHRRLPDAAQIIDECRTAVSNSTMFTNDQRKITCEYFATGEPVLGGLVITKRYSCEEIGGYTGQQVKDILDKGFVCYAPNVQGWPYANHGKVFTP